MAFNNFCWILVSLIMFVVGVRIGVVGSEPITREKAIIFCIQNPKDCKTEFDYYQLKIKTDDH